jgi:hypothetical protein
METDLTDTETTVLRGSLDTIVDQKPNLYQQYALLENFVEIINGLLLLWNILDVSKYTYKSEPKKCHTKVLDVDALSNGPISLNTVWFAMKSCEEPLM